MLAPVATSLLLAILTSGLGTADYAQARSLSRPRASVCNGFSEFCSKSYGNVTIVGAHDSYAVGSSVAANQDYNATQQLTDGIRMLQIQAHNTSDGTIHLCHTSCGLLDAGTLESYLKPVKTWVDANPNEVVTILIVNIDDLPPTSFASVYKSVGLVALSYAPSSASLASTAWPTLGEMIGQGKRVVTFMDFKADFATVPYLIDEFTNVWETAYDVTDQTFNCELNRTGTADNKMYLINHFLDKEANILGNTFPVPNKDLLNVTNAVSGYGSLGLQAQQCGTQWGKYPTFMLVDFYDYGGGSVFQVAATLNGVNYDSSTHTIAPPITASTTTASSQPTASYHRNRAARGPAAFTASTSFPLLQYLGIPAGGGGGFVGAILLVVLGSALGTVL